MRSRTYLMWLLFLFGISFTAGSQEVGASKTSIPELLSWYNTSTVPYLKVQTLQVNYKDYVIFDTRKKEEYDISHLPNATWVGEKYDVKKLSAVGKDTKIVVYCSVGIRSEEYGEEMLQDGFTQVYNLYGSIFYWKDAGYNVVDQNEKPTQRVHVYARKWATFLKTGEKVF
jgi:rhodanese-related sulfurtransferase